MTIFCWNGGVYGWLENYGIVRACVRAGACVRALNLKILDLDWRVRWTSISDQRALDLDYVVDQPSRSAFRLALKRQNLCFDNRYPIIRMF